ncbi:MAG: cysteine desulfurase [Alphaproteobacteria bacterium]|nr:cysteine desulfurase [Alphaproteobacteria bacterium]
MKAARQHTPVVSYDVAKLRAEFPILARSVHGKKLVYLDSAASAQKPRAVIDCERQVYEEEYANVHRGPHFLSEWASDRFEAARATVRKFLNAADAREIIFTRNATESINLVAATWGRRFLKAGDEVVLSEMEHHSNIVPWQMLRDAIGIEIKVAPITDDGELSLDGFDRLLGPRTKLVAITHVSNVLGTVVPVAEVIRRAHAAGAKVLIDGCQAVMHRAVDVRALGCDFYAFSGHKLYGPSGIGVLYGRSELLEAMPPYMGGGGMISSVSFAHTEYAGIPQRFEAGTPAIAQAIALAPAIEFVLELGFEAIQAHERDLIAYATQRLSAIDGLTIHGTAPGKDGVVSFTLGHAHAHDIATILDRAGIAIRAGHHCAMPLMHRLGVAATARASFGLYNTRVEVDALAEGIEAVRRIFA